MMALTVELLETDCDGRESTTNPRKPGSKKGPDSPLLVVSIAIKRDGVSWSGPV